MTAASSTGRIRTPTMTITTGGATNYALRRIRKSACAACWASSTSGSTTTSTSSSADVEGLADFRLMNALEPGAQQFPGVVYLNSMDRTDTDEAVFGQIQFDITDTAGAVARRALFRGGNDGQGILRFRPRLQPDQGAGHQSRRHAAQRTRRSGQRRLGRLLPRRRGLVAQWRMALYIPGRPQGRTLRQCRSDDQRDRPGIPRQPRLESD